MFIFGRYQLELYPNNHMEISINKGSTLRTFLDNNHIQIRVTNVQKSYISFKNMETTGLHTMDMKEFLDIYIDYMNLDMDKNSIRYRTIYSLSENGNVYDFGDEFKLNAPLLDLYKKHVRLSDIYVLLASTKIILDDMDSDSIARSQIILQEPLSISRLPEPHKDIINLPQYYIEPI